MGLNKACKSAVLITGATGPLGSQFSRSIAEELGEGSVLVLSSRSKERFEKLKSEIVALNSHIDVIHVQWDLSHPDISRYTHDLEQIKDKGMENAILIHNAGVIGNMSQTVHQIGHHLPAFQETLNINLLSFLAITTAFLDVFKNTRAKTIVNLTGGSAQVPYVSFGYTAMAKAARQMALNILALEEKDVKVMHFNPIAVDTEALRAIRDDSHDKEMREWLAAQYTDGKVLEAEAVAAVLGA